MNNTKQIVTHKKIVILGAGFGGINTLQNILRHLKRNENPEIILVNNQNYFLFSPILHEAATGVIGLSHITYPIRKLGDNRYTFIHTEVLKIDPENKAVITTFDTIDYDYLILALGSVSKMPDIAYDKQQIFTLKTLHDATLFKNQIIKMFEAACIEKNDERIRQLLTFIIVGGGYTGVQLAATLENVLKKYYTRYYKSISGELISILLIEAEGDIISNIHTSSRQYIYRHLQKSGVRIMLNSRVTRILKDSVEINGTEIIPTNTLVWATGVEANPCVAELNVEKDKLGRVHVNEYLQLTKYPKVFVLGDCAHYIDPNSGEPISPRAHNAVRQAKSVADNIIALLREGEKRRFNYTDSAEVISLGRSRALLRIRYRWIHGFIAITMFVLSYSILTVGAKNRLRLIIDWILARIYGPDITLVK
jgi:NADH dehydrogenase